MGLDISAYSRVREIGIASDTEEWEREYWMQGRADTFYVWPSHVLEPDFPGRLEGSIVRPNGVYEYAGSCYFRAGSYSGYNEWRNELSIATIGVPAKTVWRTPSAYEDSPFFELVQFSDCEGFIGPVVAGRLLEDSHAPSITAYAKGRGGRFEGLFVQWRRAFELASDGGVIKFH